MATHSDQTVGVLLFNLGGPDTTADVEPFLVNPFSQREIIELPGGPWPPASRTTAVPKRSTPIHCSSRRWPRL